MDLIAHAHARKGRRASPGLLDLFLWRPAETPLCIHLHVRRYHSEDVPSDERGLREWLEVRINHPNIIIVVLLLVLVFPCRLRMHSHTRVRTCKQKVYREKDELLEYFAQHCTFPGPGPTEVDYRFGWCMRRVALFVVYLSVAWLALCFASSR